VAAIKNTISSNAQADKEFNMRILITGGSGQLGREITEFFQANHQVFSYSSKELDITDKEKVDRVIAQIKPQVVVHTAAYTQVDLAESEQDKAFQVNGLGTRNIAIATEKVGAKLVYISTDYVFDGLAEEPYTEDFPPNPKSVYGKTKLAGENYVKKLSSRFFILRTSWVFGKFGNNFVKTMLRMAQEQNKLTVVHDQIGSPTYTLDLAELISKMIETELYGIYHVSNTGICSWYEFAEAILHNAGMSKIQVIPITTKDFPRPAPRPAYSVMDHRALRSSGFKVPRHWEEALQHYISEL
jgi:dTDP-4-dehydrorhamnose reductase